MEPGGHPAAEPGQGHVDDGLPLGATDQATEVPPHRRRRWLRWLLRHLVPDEFEPATREQVLFEDARISRLRADHVVMDKRLTRGLDTISTDLRSIEEAVDDRLDRIERMAADQPEATLVALVRRDFAVLREQQARRDAERDQRQAEWEASMNAVLLVLAGASGAVHSAALSATRGLTEGP